MAVTFYAGSESIPERPMSTVPPEPGMVSGPVEFAKGCDQANAISASTTNSWDSVDSPRNESGSALVSPTDK